MTGSIARAIATAVLFVLLAPAAALAAGGAPVGDEAAQTMQGVADRLRTDPVVVQQAMGSGDAAGSQKRLMPLVRRIERTRDTKAYVALVLSPRDAPSEESGKDLVVTLPRRLGDGVYFVATSDTAAQLTVRGGPIDPILLSLARSRTVKAVYDRLDRERLTVPPAVEAEIVLRLVLDNDPRLWRDPPQDLDADGDDRYAVLPDDEIDAIADQPVFDRLDRAKAALDADLNDEGESTVGRTTMLATMVGVSVLLLTQQTVRRAWPSFTPAAGISTKTKRRRPVAAEPKASGPPTREQLAPRVEDGLDDLAARLAGAPRRIRDHGALERATVAREVAEAVARSDDPRDLVGALTLIEAGQQDLRNATARRPAGPYRPCFFHPLHEGKTHQVTWSLDAAELQIPVCATCAADLDAGREPKAYRPARRGRDRPYYFADDVWAQTGYGALVDDYARVVAESRSAAR